MARFKVVKQRLHRHARPREAGGTVHDLRIDGNDRTHGGSLPPSPVADTKANRLAPALPESVGTEMSRGVLAPEERAEDGPARQTLANQNTAFRRRLFPLHAKVLTGDIS